ncbi:Bug family tripartite tricarboxylate transporter substrate binding protein [Ramlibacter sp. AN1133]|uniref:Bug family tripartite tricarboxylate transporter substrate binding protein n=1 Tax=Ramlibacter sp. AN1133 TaxID=3133429 RepID=UPI0030BF9528
MMVLPSWGGVLVRSANRLARGAFAVAIVAAVGLAPAQESYPHAPIKLVVPYTAGTGVDVLARAVGRHLSDRLGQPIIIDNQVGASGNIGVRRVAAASPDGYTLLSVVNTFTINPAVSSAGYDPQSLAPVAMMARSGMALVVNSTIKASSLPELVALLKRNPGKFFYASTGVGSPQHLAMELFKRAFGVEVVHVPHRSAGEANTSLLGGQTNLMFMPINIALQPVKVGRIRAFAVTTETRDPAMPEVRTVAEQGAPGFDVPLWYALLAPNGTPPSVVQKLTGELKAVLALPDIAETMAKLGMVADYMPPTALRGYISRDVSRWQAVARAANIRGE